MPGPGTLASRLPLAGLGRKNFDAITDEEAGVLPIVLGALLWPVGLIGHIFAALLKAAFSRQREFLADAFAVHRARVADGIELGFLREDAKLYIICVSDEQDQSKGDPDFYVDFFSSIKVRMINVSCWERPTAKAGMSTLPSFSTTAATVSIRRRSSAMRLACKRPP